MRLIDADALKAMIKAQRIIDTHNNPDIDITIISYHNLNNIIDNAPTVPQVTVCCENASKEELEIFKKNLEYVLNRQSGEWIDDGGDFIFKKCSNCGEEAEWLDGGSQFLSKFCPSCGAKMKKGGAV